ncbi:hypothetical protein Dimus_029306 [Dionaea muscipula]
MSILTIRDVQEMVMAFLTPERYQFGLREPGKSVVDYIDQDTLCIHLEHFSRGLRLPLPYLLIWLLNRHDLLLAQLTPNAISYILAFIILCEDKAMEATSCLFDTILALLKELGKTGYCTVEPKAGFKLVQDLPETPIIWKRKFITLRGAYVDFLSSSKENASVMLLAVWHGWFKAEACSDEVAQEGDFDST